MAIVRFAQPVTFFEIITLSLYNLSRFETFTVKSRPRSRATMLPNMSLDSFVCRLQDDEKWRIYFKPLCLRTHINTRTHTQWHTHVRTHFDELVMIAIGENATRYISPTNDTSTISRCRVITKIVNFRKFDLENESQGRWRFWFKFANLFCQRAKNGRFWV